MHATAADPIHHPDYHRHERFTPDQTLHRHGECATTLVLPLTIVTMAAEISAGWWTDGTWRPPHARFGDKLVTTERGFENNR